MGRRLAGLRGDVVFALPVDLDQVYRSTSMLQRLPIVLRPSLLLRRRHAALKTVAARTSTGRSSPLASCIPRTLHTSSARHLGFFMTPLARLLVAVTGRLTQRWWRRLSPERRRAFWEAIVRKKWFLYGGVGLLSLAGVGYYYVHLEATPITGRTRFVMFSRAELLALIAEEKEWIVQTLSEGREPLPPSHPTYQYVQFITKTILSKNRSEEFEGIDWKLYVIDSPETVNAVCLPSGEMFVFTGLLRACHNQDELAFILSHEIAHVVLGHGAEGLSHKGIIEFFSLFLIGLIWAVIPNDLISYFLHRWSHSTAQVLLDYPYSRKLETEADQVGLTFAAKACFDPAKAAKVS